MSTPLIPRHPFSIDELKERITPLITHFNPKIEIGLEGLVITVSKSNMLSLMELIYNHPELGCKYLSTVSANDHTPKSPRFNVDFFVYGLETHSYYIIIRVWIEDGETIPSSSHIWRNADWHERETYDMFGINFTDHPYQFYGHPRRILLPDNWDGFPLRKEYPHDGKSVWELGANVITASFEDSESIDNYFVELPNKLEAK